MVDVSVLEHIVEKSVFQNSINYGDTILNCNLLDIFNVSGELKVIREGNEESSNVTNRDTLKIIFSMVNVKDKTDKSDSQIFESASKNLSLENHSESHRFHSRTTQCKFDNESRKTDIIDDSTLVRVVQNPCRGDVDIFVRSSYDKESTNPPKDSMVLFLTGQTEFLRDEIKIKYY